MPLDPILEVTQPAVAEAEQGPVLAVKTPDLEVRSTCAPPLEPMAQREPPLNPPPVVGSTIKHYELLRQLGEGGMGAVYLARDTTLGRLVAIKVLQLNSGPGAERFLIEAQATARCRHDNIVVDGGYAIRSI